MDPQLQYGADSEDSSEERELYILFRHVCVCVVCGVDLPPRVLVLEGM